MPICGLAEEAQKLEDEMAYTATGRPFRYRMRLVNLAGLVLRGPQKGGANPNLQGQYGDFLGAYRCVYIQDMRWLSRDI